MLESEGDFFILFTQGSPLRSVEIFTQRPTLGYLLAAPLGRVTRMQGPAEGGTPSGRVVLSGLTSRCYAVKGWTLNAEWRPTNPWQRAVSLVFFTADERT